MQRVSNFIDSLMYRKNEKLNLDLVKYLVVSILKLKCILATTYIYLFTYRCFYKLDKVTLYV